jgi:uracil DNA glycosylase
MSEECKAQLDYIDSKLASAWKLGLCCPIRPLVMAPLAALPRCNVRLVVICKAPYKSRSMACGIPVLSGNGKETPTSRVFKSLISKYWDGVNNTNYMSLYYKSGILVLNSAFTIAMQYDDKYNITESHFPLWTNFMVPFVKKLHDEHVPIVALGVEAKGLIRNLENSSIVKTCQFPKDASSGYEFKEIMSHAISEYVFDVSKS